MSDIFEFLTVAKATAEKEYKSKKKRKRPPLSQRVMERAKPEGNEYTIYDKNISGFGLRVRPSGHRSFIMVYKKNGNTCRIIIGDAITMTLKEAEDRAFKALQNIREHGDSEGEMYRGKKWTLSELFDAYIKEHGHKRLSETWRKHSEQLFYDYIEPEFGNKLISDVGRGDLIRCISRQKSPHIQRHLQSVLSAMYNWGVNLEYVATNVIQNAKIAKVESRDRFLTEVELASVYNASYKLTAPFGMYGRFLMMSGQRRSEVANMAWGELDFEQKIWTLPANRSKNSHKHTIPLTDAMVELLTALPRTSQYVFESPINKGHPINSFSKMTTHWRKHTWVDDWRVHDLRRSLASGMAEIGIAPHVIEAVLNHRSGIVSGIAAVYNRYKYEKEKREALNLWQAHLAAVAEKYKDYVPENPDGEVEL